MKVLSEDFLSSDVVEDARLWYVFPRNLPSCLHYMLISLLALLSKPVRVCHSYPTNITLKVALGQLKCEMAVAEHRVLRSLESMTPSAVTVVASHSLSKDV